MTSILDFTIQKKTKYIKLVSTKREQAEEAEAQLAAFLATLKSPCLRKRVHQPILSLFFFNCYYISVDDATSAVVVVVAVTVSVLLANK